ncbi:MAG: hypothetical protein AAGB46_01690 [Verrucomicrobiota bacterium]
MTLAIDASLATLICLTHFIIYPSFHYISASDFSRWHDQYTRMMGYIAGPLMIAQLALSIQSIFSTQSIAQSIKLLLITLIWLSTFLQLVPLHRQLQTQGKSQKRIDQLISKNRIRLVLWLALLFLQILQIQ